MNYSLSQKANIWVLIDVIRTEEAGVHKKLHEAAIQAGGAHKSRDESRRKRWKESQTLVGDNSTVDQKDYMRSIVQYYNN